MSAVVIITLRQQDLPGDFVCPLGQFECNENLSSTRAMAESSWAVLKQFRHSWPGLSPGHEKFLYRNYLLGELSLSMALKSFGTLNNDASGSLLCMLVSW